MENPFSTIEARLNTIETLLLDLKHEPKETLNAAPTEKFLTIQEASEFLNLSVPTIYSKVSKGELPVMKRSKRLYFSSIQLMEYIKGGAQKSNADIEAAANEYLTSKKKGGLNYGK